MDNDEKLLDTLKNSNDITTLKETLQKLTEAFKTYQASTADNEKRLDSAMDLIAKLEKSNKDFILAFQNMYIVLNAQRETALQIKGMDVILEGLEKFVMSGTMV